MDLRYNTPDAGISQQFSGNISEMLYTGPTSGSKTFSYVYDPLNRLTQATSTNNSLNETMVYDLAGNITSLTRLGNRAATLGYSYTDGSSNSTGNLLQSVTNNGSAFRSYGYDANGNTTSDGGNKSIAYNLLNLPQSVTQSGTTLAIYTYDATGTKIRNTGSDGSWDYINGIVYNNPAGNPGNGIKFIQTEAGRAVPSVTGIPDGSATYHYEYNLTDHLGNVRVTFDKDPNSGTAREIQEDEYYSFGLRNGPLLDNSTNNRYLYNGKERQTDLTDQYDYGARFYDPVIGRNISIDPKAELNRRWSPYSYGLNNPVRFIDPDGMVASDFTDEDGNKRHVEDGSTAQYQEVGQGVSKHYEFTGFDQTQANRRVPYLPESNTVNLTTAIQEQQNLNASNTALNPIPGGATFCNYATQNIFSTVASATNNSSGLPITGVANSMVDQMNCSTTFIKTDQGNAQAVADKGGLGIVGLTENPNGHIVTFSVGTNEDKGQMANIGRNNGFLNINNQGDGTTPVFGSKNMANTQYFILNPAITPKSLPAPKPTTNPLTGF